jgi:hypothetical protein
MRRIHASRQAGDFLHLLLFSAGRCPRPSDPRFPRVFRFSAFVAFSAGLCANPSAARSPVEFPRFARLATPATDRHPSLTFQWLGRLAHFRDLRWPPFAWIADSAREAPHARRALPRPALEH